MAARTDSLLNEAVAKMATSFSEQLSQAHRDLFVDKRDAASPQLAYKFTFAFLTGLAVDRILPDTVPAEIMLASLKVVGDRMTP